MERILGLDRTIVPACDVDWDTHNKIAEAVEPIEKVLALKIGVALALASTGLHDAVSVAHNHGLKVIYDHQKAGTDIHEATPDAFMDRMVEAGVDAVILFPLSGPAVQVAWTKAAQDRGLGVIIGGEMTHPRFLADNWENGKKDAQNYSAFFQELGLPNIAGYIRQDAPMDIYMLAAKMGVTDFVVPGNKPERIKAYKAQVERHGTKEPAFFSPGLVAQGGDLTAGAAAAGERFHGIVGRGIARAEDIRKAAEELTAKL